LGYDPPEMFLFVASVTFLLAQKRGIPKAFGMSQHVREQKRVIPIP